MAEQDPASCFAEIAYLYPIDRDKFSEGYDGRLFASAAEAEMWVIEWAALFRSQIITSVTMTAAPPPPPL